MQNPFQLKNLYDNKEFEAVIEIWQDKQTHEAFNEWDYLYCIISFDRQKRYTDCLEVYREFHKRFPDSSLLDDKMGWALFHQEIKNYSPKSKSPEQLRRQVDYALDHCDDSKYSPRWTLIKFMVDLMDTPGSGFEQNPVVTLEYLDRVDPALLSKEGKTFTGTAGKNRQLPSDQEYWYSNRSKMLLRAKRYDECIKCCDKALDVLAGDFHSNNDTWFRYRKAMSLMNMEQTDTAMRIALPLVCQPFKHWCLWQLMFDLARSAGNDEDAIHYGAKCALADHSHEKRVTFYVKLADFWEERGKPTETALLRRLVVILREENDWGRKAYQSSWQIPNEIAQMDKREVLRELREIWRNMIDPGRELTSGIIYKYNKEKQSGIIRAGRERDKNLESYRFSAKDVMSNSGEAAEGEKVLFKAESTPKDKPPYHARDIIIVE